MEPGLERMRLDAGRAVRREAMSRRDVGNGDSGKNVELKCI